MATLRECIEAFERSQANRDPARPITVIRVAHMTTHAWRSDARLGTGERYVAFAGKQPVLLRSREAERCADLADTGEHLGITRVGLVVGADVRNGKKGR